MSASERSRVSMRSVLIASLCATVVALFLAANGLYGCTAMITAKKNPFALVRPTPEGEQLSRERGDAIVEALRVHRNAVGDYPSTLAELVPARLAQIDSPMVGDLRWQYERLDRDSFRLRYWIGPMYQNDTITQDGQWLMDR